MGAYTTRADRPGTHDVWLDGVRLGSVERSDRRWVSGWVVSTSDGRDLGDQPRLQDAVDTLVAYMTSPFRADDRRTK
jgi:hypothetical protein